MLPSSLLLSHELFVSDQQDLQAIDGPKPNSPNLYPFIYIENNENQKDKSRLGTYSLS